MRLIWYKDSVGASIISILGCIMVAAALVFIRTATDSGRTIGIVLLLLGFILIIVARCIAGSGNRPSKEQLAKTRACNNYLLKAEEARKSGDTQGEIAALEELINTCGNSLSAMVCLGAAYIRAKDYDNAIAIYKKVISLDNNCASAYAGVASAYIMLGDYSKSLYYASRSASLTSPTRSDYPTVMANYALAAGKCGDAQTAQEALVKAEAAGYKNGDEVRTAIGIQ